MCGLAGYINFNHSPAPGATTIRQMLALHKHRGPNASGVLGISTRKETFEALPADANQQFENDPDLVFGFNRLSILDLSVNGHQPMISPDGKVALMLNGEVYNFPEQKQELIKKGHAFRSTTDSEVVLHLYLEYGMEGMLNRLNGMFALAIYDARLNRLILARDRFGIKPLYILRQPGFLAFSSEMKSFGVLPGFRFELEQGMLHEFLLFRNVINNTLFKNIINCAPGTWYSISPNGEIHTRTFYDIEAEGRMAIAPDEAYEKLEQLLQDSVVSQMISDVKLGSQLSGGVDSSLVSHYASKHLEKGKFETISIIFENPGFSEKPWVEEVARRLDLQSHQYIMDGKYYFNAMDKASWHYEQPLNHPNTIGIYLLSHWARGHVTVLLSGEGADETLGGYDRFVQPAISPFLQRSFLSGLRQNKGFLKDFIGWYADPDSRQIMASAFGSLTTANGLKKDFSLEQALQGRRETLKKLTGEMIVRQRKYEILTYLPDLLMRQDKMSMAHGIENRVPFLDNHLVSAAFALPAALIIGQYNGKTETKLLLKQICAAKFGEKFAFRNKMGFGIPLREFMATAAFAAKWQEQIVPGIKSRGVFETNMITNWYNNLATASPGQLDAIWLMTGFELWAQQYLDIP